MRQSPMSMARSLVERLIGDDVERHKTRMTLTRDDQEIEVDIEYEESTAAGFHAGLMDDPTSVEIVAVTDRLTGSIIDLTDAELEQFGNEINHEIRPT